MTLLCPAFATFAALLSVLSLLEYSWERVYLWLGAALAALAIDSYLSDTDDDVEADARLVAAGSAAFLASVFVPVIVMIQAGFLDGFAGVSVGALILASAIYRWAYLDSADPTVVYGLPAMWGIIAFLLHAFDASPVAAVLAVGVALILSLLPIEFPHPVFGTFLRPVTVAVIGVSVLAALQTLGQGFPASTAARVIFGCAVFYFAVIGAIRAFSRVSQD